MKLNITREENGGENHAKNTDNNGVTKDESEFIVVSRHYFSVAILVCTIAGIGIAEYSRSSSLIF